jgi:predicted AAA+ superfamily ATPase
MISENDLRFVIKLQREWVLKLDKGIKREKLEEVSISPVFALIISGVRRCGKSTLLSQILNEQKNFYYLNLEDPRLEGFGLNDFNRAEKIFKEDYGEKGVYFFDEIQNIGKWENFVRYLVDKKEKVVLTGSNASLLSMELGTKLTGRHLDIQLLPFSYPEFLKVFGLNASSKSFMDYLLKGGFPEFLKSENPTVLNELLNDVVMRDVVNRFGIRNSSLLKKIAIYLISHVGKEFSFNSIKKMFQIKSVQTVIDYVSYFEDSYILFTVPKFSYSYKQQQVAAKKVYSIDNGLSNINSISFSKDEGRMLENSVFLHLKRRYKDVFYFQEKGECDFIVKEKEKIIKAIQVCWKIDDESKEREVNGLKETLKKFGLGGGLIITFDQEDEFEVENKKISILPAWKWLSMKD